MLSGEENICFWVGKGGRRIIGDDKPKSSFLTLVYFSLWLQQEVSNYSNCLVVWRGGQFSKISKFPFGAYAASLGFLCTNAPPWGRQNPTISCLMEHDFPRHLLTAWNKPISVTNFGQFSPGNWYRELLVDWKEGNLFYSPRNCIFEDFMCILDKQICSNPIVHAILFTYSLNHCFNHNFEPFTE